MVLPSLGILTATGRHADVAAEVVKSLPSLSGNLLYDAQTAILMQEHGIKRIYTRDSDLIIRLDATLKIFLPTFFK